VIAVIRAPAVDGFVAPVGVQAFQTEDGLYLVVDGTSAGQLAGELGTEDVTEYEHYCTITGNESPDPFQLAIVLRTTWEQQSLLADYNLAETVSAIRHLPGFCSAAFYRATREPVVLEHISWATAAHFEAARQNPAFTRHLHHVDAVAQHGWQLLRRMTGG
jgi:hypothetical protein